VVNHVATANVRRIDSFKGAWVSMWEKESCLDIFGEMEVTADDLPAMADGIIAYSAKK
jgi:2-haloacid dehalogenase